MYVIEKLNKRIKEHNSYQREKKKMMVGRINYSSKTGLCSLGKEIL